MEPHRPMDGASGEEARSFGSVLLVEDESPQRTLLGTRIEGLDWEVGTVSTLRDAIKALTGRPWSMVLVGRIDGRTGEEFVQTLRRIVPRLRVALLADAPDDALRQRLLRMGAVGCLDREAEPELLRRLLEQAEPRGPLSHAVAGPERAGVEAPPRSRRPPRGRRLDGSAKPSVRESFADAVRSGELGLPGRGDLLPRLQLLARTPEAGVDEVCSIFEADPAAAAAVLAAANAPGFAFAGSARSVRQACVRLGSRMVLSLGQRVAIRGRMRLRKAPWDGLAVDWWRSCEAAAQLAGALAPAAGCLPDEALLATLLANIGELALLAEAERWDDGVETGALLEEAGWLMPTEHPRIGQALLSAWTFDKPWCRLALRHHDPDAGSLAALTLLCTELVLEQGMTYLGASPDDPKSDVPRKLAAGLGLELDVAREQAATIVAGFGPTGPRPEPSSSDHDA